MAWLRLIRWTNLLIIFFTQILAWFCVIQPVKKLRETYFLLDLKNILLLSASTVLIAAAGYIINDYFDVRIDSINKPGKMVLEKKVPRRFAIILHTILNVIAIILAGIVAREGGHYSWLILQLFCTLLLWFYSTHFKREFATGNIVVSLLTGLTIITLVLYEPAMHYYLKQHAFINTKDSLIANPVAVLIVYSFFAFILTWIREIVKDMEDFKGDAAENCVTMPITWGLQKAGRFAILLAAVALIPLVSAVAFLLANHETLLAVYTFLAIIIPLLYWMYFLPKDNTTQHYAKASRGLKIIMVSGIGSLLIYLFEANG
jgi:4-hydroxybenzoate polyprenyltransferase